MAQAKNSDPKISKELKPAGPSSTLIVENIRPLSEYLVPKWKEFVINDISVLTGRKTIELFDLEKMNEFKLKEIDSQLQSQLPGDIYDFLKYERRRVQKKSKRKIRESKRMSFPVHLLGFLPGISPNSLLVCP
ncbi:hypothetical protein LOD99_12972 [Oopsacas minuta]|uniref:Uncharacterized protein n=1 Tax=Oopsacas minuta TaxID=111878 RepID=A0AAV7JA12_9METZ|nr:hypothetical protein LOD99_12972 [Oopsacas minuta]